MHLFVEEMNKVTIKWVWATWLVDEPEKKMNESSIYVVWSTSSRVSGQ